MNDMREQSVEFFCVADCDVTWMVDGYFDAAGRFYPHDAFDGDDLGSDADCPECGERGDTTDMDILVGDF